jgi:hypothetical protein
MSMLLRSLYSHRVGLLWIAFAVAAMVHFSVIKFCWVDWFDNVVINEIARGGVGVKTSEWTVHGYGDKMLDSQAWAQFYVGSLFVEYAYQLMGHYGPRYLMWAFHLCCALMIYWYLKDKTNEKIVPLVLAILYFTFPQLQISVKSPRVDAVAMFWMLLALSMLRIGNGGMLSLRISAFLAGVFSALGVMSWISAVMVCPIVLWEIVDRRYSQGTFKDRIINVLPEIFLLASGFCLTLAILLMPFLTNIKNAIVVFGIVLRSNTNKAQGHFLFWQFFKGLFVFPCFYAFGAAFLFVKRRMILPAAMFVAFSMLCMATKADLQRMFYLLLYCVIGVGVVLQMIKPGKVKRFLTLCLCLMAALSFFRTAVFRPLTDLVGIRYRDYDAVEKCLLKEIGRDVAVYMDTFQLYYIGRELGWRQYRVIRPSENPPDDYLSKCDYYITGPCCVETLREDKVISQGFYFQKTICAAPIQPRNKLEEIVASTGRISPILGPFRLYSKKVHGAVPDDCE